MGSSWRGVDRHAQSHSWNAKRAAQRNFCYRVADITTICTKQEFEKRYRARRPVALLKFLLRANGRYIGDAINTQNSIQVIYLVLEKFRKIAFLSGLDLVPFPANILVANANFLVPLYLHEDRKKTQTGIPDDNLLLAALRNLRIDQRPRLGTGQLQEDDSPGNSQLRRGNAATIAGLFACLRQRVAQIFD